MYIYVKHVYYYFFLCNIYKLMCDMCDNEENRPNLSNETLSHIASHISGLSHVTGRVVIC